ncbi:MAG: helicase-related protein, partial [Oscillospiraceae bacterium]
LASQHYQTLREFLKPAGVSVCLLTGSLTPANKKKLKKQIAQGEFSVIVGTHALVQKSTEFNSLGLVITDEQHRFGVEQRAVLAQKGENPHRLVMSATPIPRTLALMIYGDLDVSVLDELPKGRQTIETYAVTGKLRERAFNFIKDRISEGRQAYIICPMIDENENELHSVKSYAEMLGQSAFKGYSIGLLHGKLTASQKDKVMADFRDGKIQLLVSTTVVEVGVDVPNAAVMLIEDSERFGLSQLHQLRGRVGRGVHQSYCILVTENATDEAKERLKILSKTADGFKISEEDLKLRGPGDFFGMKQHGLPQLKIADMSQDMEILLKAQSTAKELLAADKALSLHENRPLMAQVRALFEKTGESELN